VTFTCDAFPDRVFTGKVGKIRWNATMTQNVVMYTVEVEAENPKMILLPYLTAKVQFEVQRQTDTLMVPNAALRWNPASTTELAPDVRDAIKPAGDDAPPHAASAPTTNPSDAKPAHRDRHGVVWIREGSYVRPLRVTLGCTDGLSTAVSADALHEGEAIVISAPNRPADAAARSPFMPQMIRR
jgi:HlyD family secretion protein